MGRSLLVQTTLMFLHAFGYAQILGLVKCQNAVENDAQEDEADRKAAALAERFGEFHHGDDRKDEACDRNQQEQEFPAVAPGDLEVQIIIVNGIKAPQPGLNALSKIAQEQIRR